MYAYAKQAAIEEDELEYVEMGSRKWLLKMVASLEAGNRPDVGRYGSAQVSLKDQTYAYAKQAGIKETELEYVELGTGQILPKTVAALEAGIPPDVGRYGSAAAYSIVPRDTSWR